MNTTDILRKYTAGELTADQTNEELAKIPGTQLRVIPGKNEILPGEEGKFGLLDTGTGSMDKVEIAGDELVGCDCGNMFALCFFNGEKYEVKGKKLFKI